MEICGIFHPGRFLLRSKKNFWLFNDQRKPNENIVTWPAEAQMGKRIEKAFSALFSCQRTELYVCEIVTMVLFWPMLSTEGSEHSSVSTEKVVSAEVLAWLSEPASSWECPEGTGGLSEGPILTCTTSFLTLTMSSQSLKRG